MADELGDLCIPRAAKGRAALLLARAGDLLLQCAQGTLADAGVDGREYMILSILDTDGPGSQQEIARLLRKAPAIVVAAIDGLEARDLVRRTRDPADRRRSRVMLTAAGEQTLAAADACADDTFTDLFGGLEPDELEQLKDLLDRGLQRLIEPPAAAEPVG